LIEGEHGIGKSRLLEDLLESASQLGLPTLAAGTEALEKLTPYYVWRGIFSQLLGITEVTDPSERRRRLSSKLARAGAPGTLAPLLDALMPLDLADNEITSQMAGELRADNLNQLLLDLLTIRLLFVLRAIRASESRKTIRRTYCSPRPAA
jgi:hypothetical protein